MTKRKTQPSSPSEFGSLEKWRREFLPRQTNTERLESFLAEGNHLAVLLANRVTAPLMSKVGRQ